MCSVGRVCGVRCVFTWVSVAHTDIVISMYSIGLKRNIIYKDCTCNPSDAPSLTLSHCAHLTSQPHLTTTHTHTHTPTLTNLDLLLSRAMPGNISERVHIADHMMDCIRNGI